MLDIKGWISGYCIKTEICNRVPRNGNHVHPCPTPTPQLLEIATDIAAIGEKKNNMDMTVTYIILRHNM